jgi:hypothetical protein
MKTNNSSNNENSQPTIIDPVPHRPTLPTMHTVQDAIDVCQREKSNFFLSAFMFQGCVHKLSLDCVAQLAEQPDPAKRRFQTGQARQEFAKRLGGAPDGEFAQLAGHLWSFALHDDQAATQLLEAGSCVEAEHQCTGDFLGSKVPASAMNDRQKHITLIRDTVNRHADWLDAIQHLRAYAEWHFLPEAFDPDPAKRELFYLGLNQHRFDKMNEASQAHYLNHMSDFIEENGGSAAWDTFRKASSGKLAQPRPWPTQDLDLTIIKFWPLVTRYDWSGMEFLLVLKDCLSASSLAPLPTAPTLMHHCDSILSLRHDSLQKNSVRHEIPGRSVALRLRATNQNS